MPRDLERRRGTALWVLAVLMLLEGRATGSAYGGLAGEWGFPSRSTPLRRGTGSSTAGRSAASVETRGVGGLSESTEDAFQQVQAASGLEEGARHPAGAALYVGQARQLLGQLTKTPVTQIGRAHV